MAAPQEQYPGPGQGYPAPDPYAQQNPGAEYGAATSPPPQAGNQELDGAGKKKKRGYAAQAYDFGAGANSALGGQPQGGGQFQPVGAAPAYGGFQQPGDAQASYGAPQYGGQMGAPYTTPTPGAPVQNYGNAAQFDSGVGGYQPPDTSRYPDVAGYPPPDAPAGGVGGITQGMGRMGMGGAQQPAAAQPQQVASKAAPLNQLYPTDLLNQPFNVAELDLPPPPIILPPNVSFSHCQPIIILILCSQVSHLPQMRTVHQNTSAQL